MYLLQKDGSCLKDSIPIICWNWESFMALQYPSEGEGPNY